MVAAAPQPADIDWNTLGTQTRQFLRETVDDNDWIRQEPHPKQRSFLACPLEEVLFGGAAGGAKSKALLMAAAQYVNQRNYAALLLRRTFPMLSGPGGLIPMSKDWWMNSEARWSETDKCWTFPSGAIIKFGYLDTDNDAYQYQGLAFDFIGFDELTHFSEFMYRYLFSRLRRAAGSRIPSRMRASANPGGVGHEWVKKRFIVGREGHFIPSKLEDNPSLDQAEYEGKLAKLDPVTRRQLRHGDWNVRPEGNLFKRSWFKVVSDIPNRPLRALRFWDLAATVKKTESDDPDYTVGCKVFKLDRDTFLITDVIRFRGTPEQVERLMLQTARRDGFDVQIRMEQEGGSAGKSLASLYARKFSGFDFRGVPSHQDKVTRAQAPSAACERGDVLLLEGAWNHDFLDELCAFPEVGHDDQVDAFCGALNALTRTGDAWDKTALQRMFGDGSDENYEVIER